MTIDYKCPQSLGPDYETALMMGIIPGSRGYGIYARMAGSLQAGSVVDLRPEGDTLQYLTSPERLSISSTSASDTALGTGAQAVLVEGLGPQLHETEEVVVLNGTTPVLTANTYLRVNRMITVAKGSAPIGTNVGTIDAISEVTARHQVSIQAGYGWSTQSHYSTGPDMQSIITTILATIGKNDEAELILTTRQLNLDGTTGPWLSGAPIFLHDAPLAVNRPNFVAPGQADLKVVVRAITANPRIAYSVVFAEQGR